MTVTNTSWKAIRAQKRKGRRNAERLERGDKVFFANDRTREFTVKGKGVALSGLPIILLEELPGEFAANLFVTK